MVKLNWLEKFTICLLFVSIAIVTNPFEITQYTIMWRYTLIEIIRIFFFLILANIVIKFITGDDKKK